MATVTQKVKGGKWYAIYTDATGKQRWKSGYTDKGETQRLANRLEDDARQVKLGYVDPQSEARRAERIRSVTDHLTAFRAHMDSNARDPNHVNYTIRDCRLCFDHAGIVNARALTLRHVDAWRTHCMKLGYPHHRTPDGAPKPDSRKTVNRRIASVRALLRYLRRIGAVETVVLEGYRMLQTKGHETSHRRALSRDEVAKLLDKTPDAHRREIYRFAIYTGFRRSEIASMTPAAFDFKRKAVRLNARHAKRKTDHQTLPLHTCLIEPVRKLCEGKGPDERIFNVPRRQSVVGILHADCKTAEVDVKDVDFHGLRHTFCSLLAEANIRPEVLMKLARHRDVATTMRYYVHFRPDDERTAIERL